MRPIRLFTLILTLALLLPSAPAAGLASAAPTAGGAITEASLPSPTLGENIRYNVYLPEGYATSGLSYPVFYLLHGRGDSMAAWVGMKSAFDDLIATRQTPPFIAIMPDAPWSSAANYFVDSAYTGAAPGRPVETAFINDLIPHVDRTYRTVADRMGRGVAGYSMGGYGALRYLLAHPDLFGAAVVLSPAVYTPLPPADSSTREFGAFGQGSSLFVDSIYQAKNYPALLAPFAATGLAASMYIYVGDDEWPNPNPEDYEHDLDIEAHKLYNQVRRLNKLSSEFRVVNGGHSWDVWRPGFIEGAKFAFQTLRGPAARRYLPLMFGAGGALPEPEFNKVVGTYGEDIGGGVATDTAGNVYLAAGVEGAIDGQPYLGAKDVVVQKFSANGDKVWTRQFGTSGTDKPYALATDGAGNVYVAGYTKGDLDGAHAGNTSDDGFVAKLLPDGTLVWAKQFGVASAADRAYGLAVAPDGTAYVGGYSKGNLAGTNQGDKDIVVASYASDGTQRWLQMFGGAGEDKAWAVAVGGEGSIYVAGMTNSTIGAVALGELDGFLARYTADGTRAWVEQFGTAANDEAWGVTADANGNAFVAGYTAGDFQGTLAGDKDMIVAKFAPDRTLVWKDQVGTATNDKGVTVRLDAAGNLYLAGFSDGNLAGHVGEFDVVLVKYGASLAREWVRQFGTTANDGGDVWAEGNLFMATHGNHIYLAGLTAGDFAGYAQLGAGDVFLTRFNAAGAGGPVNRERPFNATIATAGEDVGGGVATDTAGNVYLAAGVEGAIDGQPYLGAKDVVVQKFNANGDRVWTRQFGASGTDKPYALATDGAGNVYVAGYTKGDLDGAHAGNTSDDGFVAKLLPDGTLAWAQQFGVASAADRAYGLAVAPDGTTYVGGYSKGNLVGTNQGDKDIVVASYASDGTQRWLQMFGGSGEDKAWAVAVGGEGSIYVAGMTNSTLGAAGLGELDGFLARYTADGTRAWVEQFGTAANDEGWGVTADASGNAFVAGYTAGDFQGALAGDKDMIVAKFAPDRTLVWKDQVGTATNDKGVTVRLDAAGNLYLAGFSDGNLAGHVGEFDVVLVKYGASLAREWVRQFGTTANDGGDVWAEGNLFMATHGNHIYLAGLTAGDFAPFTQMGNGDVFLTRHTAAGVRP